MDQGQVIGRLHVSSFPEPSSCQNPAIQVILRPFPAKIDTSVFRCVPIQTTGSRSTTTVASHEPQRSMIANGRARTADFICSGAP